MKNPPFSQVWQLINIWLEPNWLEIWETHLKQLYLVYIYAWQKGPI